MVSGKKFGGCNKEMIDFNKMPYIYLSDIEKCNMLERYILVHSMLYYDLNENVITDKEYDDAMKQLKEMFDNMDVISVVRTQYSYVFEEFVTDTGFDLCSRLDKKDRDKIQHICYTVLKLYKQEHKKT